MNKKNLFAVALIVTILFLGTTKVEASMVFGSTCGSTSSNPCPPDYFISDQNGGAWGVTGGPGNWVLKPMGLIASSNSTVYLNWFTLPKVLQVSSTCTNATPPVCQTTVLNNPSGQVVAPVTTPVVAPVTATATVTAPVVVPVVVPVVTVAPVVVPVVAPITAPTIVDRPQSPLVITPNIISIKATSSVSQTSVQSSITTQLPSICSYLSYSINIGSRGNNVFALQNFLKDAGYFNLDATGYFGPVTFKAVQSFQMANGLEAVGNVGPMTRGKIGKAVCGK